MFFLYLPLAEGGVYLLLTAVPRLGTLLDPGLAVTSRALYLDALVVSLVGFAGLVLGGLLFVLTVPRLLNLFIRPGAVYPLYGFHDRIHRAIARMTGVKFFTHLFGDSSYIVYYLRCLGYDLSRVEQTGSNFGTEVRHENPYLSAIGSGTMVPTGCRSSTPTSPARHSACPGCRSGRTTSWGTTSPTRPAGQDGRQLPARDEGR